MQTFAFLRIFCHGDRHCQISFVMGVDTVKFRLSWGIDTVKFFLLNEDRHIFTYEYMVAYFCPYIQGELCQNSTCCQHVTYICLHTSS